MEVDEVSQLEEAPPDDHLIGRRKQDFPPEDDVCPICFGDFTFPCKTACGHWYCASCILQLWNYTATTNPCKCPMCSRTIDKLTPQESLLHQREENVVKVLKEVQQYNLLFVGGTRGLLQKVYKLPHYLKRCFLGLMDPDQVHPSVSEIRVIAMLLSALYMAQPFDFIPTDEPEKLCGETLLFAWRPLCIALRQIQQWFLAHALLD